MQVTSTFVNYFGRDLIDHLKVTHYEWAVSRKGHKVTYGVGKFRRQFYSQNPEYASQRADWRHP